MKQSMVMTASRPATNNLGGIIAGGCAAILVIGVALAPSAAWTGALVGGVFGFTLALGGTLFIAVHTLAGARWWLGFKGVPATLSLTLWAPAIAILATIVLGFSTLYPWASEAARAGSHLLHEKAAWLNPPFFFARAALVLAFFGILSGVLGRSCAPDRLPSGRVAAGFIVFFAIGISLAFWDWVMSLEPEWFSTMFAVYGFSSVFVGGIAAITVIALYLEGRGLGVRLTDGQRHDLGKLLFAFSTFWAYIWFCQYMLIWYANLPEETPYFVHRLSNGWAMLFWLNPILSFIVPFLALLSARAKKHRPALMQVALIILAGRWLDTYLMIAPATRSEVELPVYAFAATFVVLFAMLALGARVAPTLLTPRSR